ncbi:DNA ligase [candidate division GN15 bacterium]|nr:DNA ligase [candidate division GN15 bacterium]
MSTDKLKEYKKKRDFGKTSEPEGGGRSKGGRAFVIQKHDASNLHYDFRLEVDGVLKSWAVPKGPSTNPSDKRMAIETEDHPMGYKDFEGVIPEGEYGAGPVMVWDHGTYKNMKRVDGRLLAMDKAYDKGRIEIWLEGEKLKGGYALVRTGKKSDKRWLLIKMKDDEADARRNPVSSQPKSVISGRTLKQIEADESKKQGETNS